MSSLIPLNPASTPLFSKNLLYIQCSFVVGLSIKTILFCTPFSLIDKSIVSNVFSSISSSASSSTQQLIPCKDFRLAVWFPEEVFIPLNTVTAKDLPEPRPPVTM